MDNKNGFMGYSAEDIRKIVSSPQAKEILQRLNQNGGQAFQKAKSAAKQGDFESVRELLEPLLKDQKTAALVNDLQRKQDKHG